MLLYHATFGSYIPSIREQGLLSHLDGNPNDSYGFADEFSDEVFLSDDEYVAQDYAETADNVPDDVYDSGIYIVTVDVNENNLEQDRWVDGEDTHSYVHHGSINPEQIVDIVQVA